MPQTCSQGWWNRPFRVSEHGAWVPSHFRAGVLFLSKMKSNGLHQERAQHSLPTLNSDHVDPHPTHPEDNGPPTGPYQERDWRLKKYSTRSKKNELFPRGRSQSSCLWSACAGRQLQVRTAQGGMQSQGQDGATAHTSRCRLQRGVFCPVAVWSLRKGNDCHVMLRKDRSQGPYPPRSSSGASLPAPSFSLTHPPKWAAQSPSQQRQENK